MIRPIYIPPLVVESGAKRRLEVSAMLPVQYLERRSDNLFELKEIELPTGVDVVLSAEREDQGTIRLTDIFITLRWIASRQRIDGVRLNVGRPVLQSEKFRFYLRVDPERDYGILIEPKGSEGLLLLRLRASLKSVNPNAEPLKATPK